MILRTLFCMIVLACAAIAEGQGTPIAEPASSGIVLLRNGHVLEGKAQAAGDVYTVELASGGILRVPAVQVDSVCRDLAEAYQLKASRVPNPTAMQRIDLAEWCLRHDLHSQAAQQILVAQREEPDHPRTIAVERKLLARLAELRALAERPIIPAAIDEADEATMTAISPKAMETFSSSVQPMLLNRCGVANCHGPASTNGFQLTRSPWGNSQPRRFTQKNLQSVLKFVDRDNLASSKILKAPLQPHGTAKQPLFGDRDSASLRLLAGWLEQLHAPPEATRPAKIEKPSDLSLRATGAPSMWMPIPGEEGASAVPLPTLRAPVDAESNPANPSVSPSAGGDQKVPAIKPAGKTPPQNLLRDPFDPAAFNQLHHGPPPQQSPPKN